MTLLVEKFLFFFENNKLKIHVIIYLFAVTSFGIFFSKNNALHYTPIYYILCRHTPFYIPTSRNYPVL